VRVLVTGGAGLVAGHLLRSAPEAHEVELTWRTTRPPEGVPAHRVDLCVPSQVETLLERVRPEVVIHTAYSAQHRADVVDASHEVATACARHDVQLVHLSTDVVFSGDAPPYVESDPMEPVSDYGRWKADAERLVTAAVAEVCITRCSLVVSLDPPDAGTRWLLGAVDAGERPVLFRDEHRTPIRAVDLAATLWALVDLDPVTRRGIWHLPGPERLSRLELGRRVLRAAGRGDAEVVVGSVQDHPTVRAVDTTLRSRRRPPGPAPQQVP
jgi:dTDP-4-dehydrorhamnose reductase